MRKIRNFILPETGLFQKIHRPQIQVRLEVVVREGFARLHPPGQGGVLLHLEAVAGQVLGLKGDGLGHGGLPALQGLAGEAVNEVQGDVFELGLSGGAHRLDRLLRRVGAAHGLQFPVLGGLHPDRQPVKAPGAELGKHFQADAVRVGLQGDFRVPVQLIIFLHRRQQGQQAFFSEQAGGAAAEIHGIHRAVGGAGRLLQVGQQGVLIGVHLLLPARQRVKITVRAFRAAEGNVQIKPQLVSHRRTPRFPFVPVQAILQPACTTLL